MRLIFSFVEVLAVFLVVFYLYCRSPAFRPLKADWPRPRGKVRLYLVFSFIGILGNFLGIPVVGGEAIVNARAVGSTLAGLLGGPLLGMLVGVTAGIHRISMGGGAAVAGAVATTLEGVLAGMVHLSLKRRPRSSSRGASRSSPRSWARSSTWGSCWLLMRPYPQALAAVKIIGPPMILLNPIGAALFMTVLLERQRDQDQVAAASSASALKVAERALGLMARGFGRDVAGDMAAIVKQETGVGAVGVTDTERVLAWVGIGDDHHVPGTPIVSPFTRQSIASNRVVFADGLESLTTVACRGRARSTPC